MDARRDGRYDERMLRQASSRLRKSSILLLLLLAPHPAGAAAPRLSARYAAVVAHFDSTVGCAPRERVWAWLDAIEAAAPADSELRVVTRAQRAALAMQWGQYAEARRLSAPALARARATRDTLLLCRVLATRASADMLEQRTTEARAEAGELLALARAARRPRHAAPAHLALAYMDLVAGRAANAVRGYRAALREYSPTLDINPRRIVRIGLARALFQLGRAAEAQRIDIELVRESRHLDDPVAEAYALNNLAVHQELAGDPAGAAPCYRRALAIQQRLERWDEAATTASNLSHVLLQFGRTEDAAAVLQAVADSGGARIRRAGRLDVLEQLARVRVAQQRFDGAEGAAARAWALCDSLHVAPSGTLAVTRARLLHQRGRTAEALALLEHWRETTPDRSVDQVDAVMVRAATATLLDASGRPQEALQRWTEARAAIDTASARGRARLVYAWLNESLSAAAAGQRARAHACFDAALAQWERARSGLGTPEWRESLEIWDMRTWGSASGARVAVAPAAGRDAVVREVFDLLQHVKGRTLEERAAGRAAPPVTADALQRRVLRPGELALDFFYARDSLLVFALTRDALRLEVIHGIDALEGRADRLAGLAADPAPAAAPLREAAAAALARDLLAPFRDLFANTRRVIVSGGGLADALPWALLPLPGAAAAARVDVASVPSLSTLARLRTRAGAGAPHGLLVLANPAGPGGARLAGVERERAWLAARYAGTDARTPRDGASVRASLAAMPAAAAIHVAAHVADDADDPWHCGVLLGDPRRDDAWVRAPAIAALRLRADLVVLAGCSSAQAGDNMLTGAQGLATAFVAAGAGTVIGTRWPVSDAATAEFVPSFYRALDDGLDVGAALARARDEMRTSEHWNSPAHWAGFVVLGDPAVRIRLPRRGLPGWPVPASAATPTGR